jgi:hypothetical protein
MWRPEPITTSFVVSSVGPSTCGMVASSDVAVLVGVENVGLSVRGWVGFHRFRVTGSCGCGVDNTGFVT